MDCKKLVSQMTLEEKAQMCSGADFWHSQGVERLGIPPVMMTDGPCGLRKQAGETDHLGLNESVSAISYPTGSCVASSFDRQLLRTAGEALGEECQAEDVGVILGPAVNIKRSPLCGRNFEYFSEDPYLAGELAAAYINGVQSKNVGTSLKHFALNSMEHYRMTGNSAADERTFREIYLPAFEKAVKEAQPWTVMCSYNQVDGTFASENHKLLTEILRDEWGFEGFVVSDWGAVNDRVKGVPAGLDLEMPGPGAGNTRKLIDAVKNGTLSEEALDTAVERILTVLYKYLENRQPDAKFPYEKDHALARKMAGESMILLKNEGVLPLSRTEKVAFIGEFADHPRFQGGGSSHVNSYKVTGALEASQGCNVVYAKGYPTDTLEPDDALIAQAVETAKSADKAVLFIGITDAMESEGFDRTDLKLPSCQEKLIEEVLKVQKNTVAVVHCGGCVEMPWIDGVKGVLYAYLGGEAVGEATVDLLYGDVNPSGKLAETFPLRLEDNPSYLYYFGEKGGNTEYREGVFVGYRYYDKKSMPVLFPFGYGLSYTKFSYSGLKLSKTAMKDDETLEVSVRVKNVGDRAGKEIVQLYVGDDESSVIRPARELKGFEKVELEPGEEKEVTFTLDKRSFAYYDADLGDWYAEGGSYTVYVGASSRDLPLSAQVTVEPVKPMHQKLTLNSPVAQVLAVPGAKEALGGIFGAFSGDMENAADASGSSEMMEAMLREMPLRAVAMFSGGSLDAGMLEEIVEKLNG